ncbi:alpha/beta fold hydrolase [Nonlabens agnitus]|uniref:AB hydrolase-1 domain-containing protein n=1 Tax=Nonlabens agnitus TaxID=870484 RepID=A0A2S9WWK0_9FLAO|nr:alpha/beta hydrolase [Nonlabens agnitus]PRP67859.1 hypothetical protein BST86_12505 [Nonlabens agnitus]
MTHDRLLTLQCLPKTGPTILFLHGFLGSSDQWSRMVEHYKESYQILLLELPGHGDNSCEKKYTLDDLAQEIHQVLLQYAVDEIHFVGHSMGGYVGCAFAKAYPSKLLSLTLINSCATNDSTSRVEQRDRSLTLIQKYPQAFTKMAISNLFTTTERENYKAEIESMKQQAARISMASISNALIAMRDRPSFLPVLEDTSIPLQYIYGSRDEIIPPATIEVEIEKLKAINYELESGHMSLVTHPNEIIKLQLVEKTVR